MHPEDRHFAAPCKSNEYIYIYYMLKLASKSKPLSLRTSLADALPAEERLIAILGRFQIYFRGPEALSVTRPHSEAT